MNMKIKHIYFGLALILLTASCNKTEDAAAPVGGIRFAGPVETKATDAANHSDIFQVRDWYNNSSYLIENTLEYKNNTWDYGTSNTYEWKNGTHKFFGWLQKDGSYTTSSLFGSGFNLTGTTLNIPKLTMNNQVRQYDFLYSNVVERSTYDNDYSDVPLVFNHLFAQVAISFKISPTTADSERPITLYQVYINDNLKNSKSASIDFSAAGKPAVTYDNVSSDGLFATPADFSTLGDYDKTSIPIDVLGQIQIANKAFYYVWPTDEADLQNVISVVYKIDGDSYTRTSVMSFPAGTKWEAGNKYQYTITYMGGILKIVDSVLPWDYVEEVTSVEEQSVMAQWMGWDASTCVVNDTDITFTTYPAGDPKAGKLKKIHGMFKIYSPTQCTYHINMTQNADKYTIENGTGTIGPAAGDFTPGTTIDFYITADDDDRPAAGQPNIISGLSFSVTASGGRDYSLDSELQIDGPFNIIIPSM